MAERTRKSPREIAEDRLGVADRRVKALEKKRDKAQTELNEASAELAQAKLRRDYLAEDPALKATADDTPLLFEEDGVDDAPIDPCPECAAGKHGNCTHDVPVGDTDELGPCPCEERDHKAAGA